MSTRVDRGVDRGRQRGWERSEWVSMRVLELTGPLPSSVEGGVILMDDMGAPTGESHILRAAVQSTRARLTSVHDAGLDPGSLEFFVRYIAPSYHLPPSSSSSPAHAVHRPRTVIFRCDFPVPFTKLVTTESGQIRIYGMRFFDEKEPYWGNVSKAFVGAANGHLTARNVKIF
ncbi:hypothetical protein DFH07DRAFT_770547 [Mycena maculata]|uniref:Uncharacterized protein n=1 Tax=Mycena maculata TaxID=230809 RepID=A0AAD7JIH0_9AGAR|nr:hypothetical protein DFH07DRAFT_770547 [Mycena maculata]